MSLDRAIEAATEACIRNGIVDAKTAARIIVEAAAPHMPAFIDIDGLDIYGWRERAGRAEAEVAEVTETYDRAMAALVRERALADRLAHGLLLALNGENPRTQKAAYAAWEEARRD